MILMIYVDDSMHDTSVDVSMDTQGFLPCRLQNALTRLKFPVEQGLTVTQKTQKI